MDDEFQSAPPVREATGTVKKSEIAVKVSIRASREGGDDSYLPFLALHY